MKEDNEQRTIKADNNNLLSLALNALDSGTSSWMHNQVQGGKW